MAEDTKKLGKGGAVLPEKKPRRLLRFGCMIALCFALIPIAVNLMVSFLAREEFRRELELARKAGMPRSLSGIAPPTIPDEENAAKIYAIAFPQVVAPVGTEDLALEAFYTMKVDLEKERAGLEVLRGYVEKNRSALDRLHEGARLPGCRFDLQYADGFSMAMPHLSSIRGAAKLMRLEARLLLADGKNAEALRAIRDLYVLSDATREEPVLISLLVRVSMHGMAADALRRTLQEPVRDAEAVASLAEALERGRDDDHFSRALRGEQCFGVDTMERVRREGWSQVSGAVGLPQQMGWVYRFFGWALYNDMTYYLRTMSKYSALSDQPYWQSRPAEAKLEQEVQAAPQWYLMSRMIMPSLASARRAWTKHLAKRDGARLAVAIARYRLSHGSYPEKLEQLVPAFLPELPVDPFTGSPFAWRVDGDSARVYSLGPLGFDNGGGTTAQDDEGTVLWPLGDQEPFQGK
ncbi:MAG: hypothetical protein HY720_32490 [Planctomycetes bacterium]|nr:hypothetical protein [Planctomycetota bacterium]